MSWINELFACIEEIKHLGTTHVGLLVPKRLFELLLRALQLGELGIQLSHILFALLNYSMNLFLVFWVDCKRQCSLSIGARSAC